MATVDKVLLSGSTDGRQILVVATATAGTTIHTATATNDGSVLDEIWLWAVNTDTTNRKLTIEFGGTTTPNDIIEVTIPAESGYVLVVPGLCLENSVVVRAFAASASVVNINGYVNRITN